MTELELPEGFALTLFEQVKTRFLEPELTRRIEAQNISVGDPIYGFLVILKDSGPPAVLLNGEVTGEFSVKMVEPRSQEEGDPVAAAEIEEVTDYKPSPEVASGQYIVGMQYRYGWGITFDFNRIHPDAEPHLMNALGFLETAKDALSKDRMNPFADNAFTAAELLARAELLCALPTAPRIEAAKTHDQVKATYNLWSHLENTDPRFSRVLNVLGKNRDPAKYGRGHMQLTKEQCADVVDTLEEMAVNTHALINRELDGPRKMNLHAKRSIKAGEIVGLEDMSMEPPNPPEG